MFLVYYPPGVEWNCDAYALPDGWPGCDPDFTADHEPSQARLVHIPNHQHGEYYWDAPPMYRQ
jgi:hypothetical protein